MTFERLCSGQLAPRLAPHASRLSPYSGFTYIGLLIFIAILGAALAGTGVVWHTQQQREKERELLFVGEQFRRAIGQYYERSPGVKMFPRSLDDLLRDDRYPNVQRYLRKRYADPMSGTADWGLVEGPQGGIVGVHSRSEARPIKQAHFRATRSDFEGRARYADWRFVYVPQETPVVATGRKD